MANTKTSLLRQGPQCFAICFCGAALLMGCSSPSNSVSQNSNVTETSIEPEERVVQYSQEKSTDSFQMPLKVTTSVLIDGGRVETFYDRFDVTSQVGNTHAADGAAFLVLHYKVVNKPSRGGRTVNASTALFAICTKDNVTYGVDASSRSALEMDKVLKKPNEAIEYFSTELHPGIQRSLVTLFQVPIEQLKNSAYLVVPDEPYVKKIPLKAIAERLGSVATSNASPVVEPVEEVTSTEQTETKQKAVESNEATEFASTGDSGRALAEKLIDAQVAGDEGKYTESIAALAALKKPASGHAEEANRLNKLGLSALKAKDYINASTLFKCALQADPSVARYASNLGFAEMYNGDLDLARNHLYDSLTLDATREVAWDNLGQVFAKQDDRERAIACFKIAYKISGGKTLFYLQSLDADEDPKIREIGKLALDQVKPN